MNDFIVILNLHLIYNSLIFLDLKLLKLVLDCILKLISFRQFINRLTQVTPFRKQRDSTRKYYFVYRKNICNYLQLNMDRLLNVLMLCRLFVIVVIC